MPVNVLNNSTLSSAVSSRVASSGFLAKLIISNIDKMKESIINYSRYNYPLSSNNGYLLYLQNNNTIENSSESMNIIYDAESLITYLDDYLQNERENKDSELGEFRETKKELEEKIEAKEEELNEEGDESTQIKLYDELKEMRNDLSLIIEEDEKKCEFISRHDSLIDDVYTVKSTFSKALYDGITTGRYIENGEFYILIRSNNMNTSLTNIFNEDDVFTSEIFEEFEVVDIEMEEEEEIEEEGEEDNGEVDEDGFQRLPSTINEDASNNIDDDPSSDDDSDDPSTEEEIKDANEEKEFVVKNGFSYCNGCKSSICSCFNEKENNDDYEIALLRNQNILLLKNIQRKDDEIEKLKALLNLYIK